MQKKVEELVAKRIEEEIQKREEIIQAEVQKRLVEAKKAMEKDLQDEFEKLKQVEYKKQLDKEVRLSYLYKKNTNFSFINYNCEHSDAKFAQKRFRG